MKNRFYLFVVVCVIVSLIAYQREKTSKKEAAKTETSTNAIEISGEGIKDRASIDSIKIEKGHIKLHIKNLKADNKLMSVYLKYTCYDSDNKELSSNFVDTDLIGIEPGAVSEEMDFVPDVLDGSKIVVTIRGLVYENSNDNIER